MRLEQNQEFTEALREEIISRNRRLPDFKRVGGYLIVGDDFPRTASMKIKRNVLAEEARKKLDRAAMVRIVSDADSFLAVVNPAAAGGRCRKLVPAMRSIVCEQAG